MLHFMAKLLICSASKAVNLGNKSEQWQTLGANFMFLASLLNETCLILHVLPKKL